MYSLLLLVKFFLFKQKTADVMRSSDWSSDVCPSDLLIDPSRGGSTGRPDGLSRTIASPSRKITLSLSIVALLPPSGGSCQSRGVSQDRNDVAPLRACRVLARCRCPRLRRAGRGQIGRAHV